MQFDPATTAALENSIEHWTRLSLGTRNEGEGINHQDCALCRRFYNKTNECAGCPVKAASGAPYCEDTPYERASEIARGFGISSDEFRAAAKLELEFIEGLRQPVEAKA